MKNKLALALVMLTMSVPAGAMDTPGAVVTGTTAFEMRVLATGLDNPWEVTWGPDDFLWLTERTAGRINRIDPADGAKTTLIDIGEVSAPGGQDGLLGLALHPALLKGTGADHVFAAYTYVDQARGPDPTVTDPASPYRFLYAKIVRLTYDRASDTLTDPIVLIAGLPASNDHNSGRLKFGPDAMLYYTIGDGGKNQLGNWCIPIEAQRLPTPEELAAEDYIAYQGKALRIGLDGGIPADNPKIGGVVSHVFTYGHRNMQGIDFAPDGRLYASEQGAKTDDEVNILVPAGNYGWPHVAGFRDDRAYQYARWQKAATPCKQLQFSDIAIDPSVPVEDETRWTEPMQDPLATLFTVPSNWDFTDPTCDGVDFICWPTVAASSIQTYMPESTAIPGWENSLLVPSLKRGSIYLLPLASDGQSLRGPVERCFRSENRYRDLALSRDHRTLYVATDTGGLVEALAGGITTTMQHPGSILVFSYTGNAVSQASPARETSAAVADETPADAGQPPRFTAAQADRGQIAYRANCVSCHGQNLISATYGTPLAGVYFAAKWRGKTVGALYRKSLDTMPPSRPGTLPPAVYADIVAYILSVNGLAAGDAEMPADPPALDGMTITTGATQ